MNIMNRGSWPTFPCYDYSVSLHDVTIATFLVFCLFSVCLGVGFYFGIFVVYLFKNEDQPTQGMTSVVVTRLGT